jgi:hypothetical protein
VESAPRSRIFSAHPHRRLRASPAALSTVGATGATAILDQATARFYTLNDVGGRVWSLLRDGTTFAAIVDQLACEYNVAVDVLHSDTEQLLLQLAEAELLRVE